MQLMIDGKIVGELKDGVLVKKGRQVVLFRRYDGFGFTQKIVDTPGIQKILVNYNGVEYITSPAVLSAHGIRYDNHGEEQIVLPRKWWGTQNEEQLPLL